MVAGVSFFYLLCLFFASANVAIFKNTFFKALFKSNINKKNNRIYLTTQKKDMISKDEVYRIDVCLNRKYTISKISGLKTSIRKVALPKLSNESLL